jgi:hypothetical protein
LSSSSPRKQALRRQPRRERETSGEEEDGDVAKFCVCDKLLPQNLATIVKMQVTLNKNAPRFRKYSREYKQFAITLFFLSPMAYRFLRTTFLLPTVRTLQRMTEKIRINPGLSGVVFDILKIKANSLGDEGKDCVLCADEMSIKGHLLYDIHIYKVPTIEEFIKKLQSGQRTGQGSSKFLFFDAIDNIIGDSPTNNCTHSLNSKLMGTVIVAPQN